MSRWIPPYSVILEIGSGENGKRPRTTFSLPSLSPSLSVSTPQSLSFSQSRSVPNSLCLSPSLSWRFYMTASWRVCIIR